MDSAELYAQSGPERRPPGRQRAKERVRVRSQADSAGVQRIEPRQPLPQRGLERQLLASTDLLARHDLGRRPLTEILARQLRLGTRELVLDPPELATQPSSFGLDPEAHQHGDGNRQGDAEPGRRGLREVDVEQQRTDDGRRDAPGQQVVQRPAEVLGDVPADQRTGR